VRYKGLEKRVLVIGAGPGGLTTAIALRRAGFDARVFERADGSGEHGSGLTLWPNALKAFAALGLDGEIRAIGTPTGSIAMRNWRGARLFRVKDSGGVTRDALDASGLALHRAEFVSVLLRALGDGAVAFGASCSGFRQSGSGVTAIFADGAEVEGDVLVGADGLNSTIRAQLFGGGKARYAGYTVWRGVADATLGEEVGTTTMGRASQFGFFPMSRGRVYWFASASAPEGQKDGEAGRKVEVLGRFGDWHSPVGALIRATPEAEILRNDVYDRESLKRWSVGRVTLLGDAAHPSTPDLGQGACQAIEDAVVLAGCLRERGGEPAAALEDYETRRRPRANAMSRQARRIGRMGRWKNPLACWLRDKMIEKTPESVRLRHLKWMFDFKL